MAKNSNKFPVILSVQGQTPRTVMVGSGATVKTVLEAAKLDPNAYAGAITLDDSSSQLSDRVKKDSFLSVTPKVAGGR